MRLAQAGARVVVLERGPYYTLRDFTHDEVAICRRDFFVPSVDTDPHTVRKDGGASATRTSEGWIGVNVGGGTVHMSGFTYRLHEEDFTLKSRTGGLAGADLADWPIAYADFARYYDLTEALLGVSGAAGINPFESRSRPYPMPPMRAHPAAALVDEAARGLGYHPFPTPRAVVSRAYGSRPPCTYCGFCGDYGCENGSKSSVLSTFIPRAIATGRCEIRAEARVVRIVVDDAAPNRVRGVEYVDASGISHVLEARIVVLAASAIESARLLLLSTSTHHPHGLGNGSGLVGRNLTFSTFGKATASFSRAALRERLGEADMDLPFLQRSVQDDYWMPRSGLALGKGGTYNFILHHPNPINATMRMIMESDWELAGEALSERMRRYFHDELWMEVEIFGEFLPTARTYIDLDDHVRDAQGLPVARISVQQHPADVEVSRVMTQRSVDMLSAIQPAADKVWKYAEGGTTFHLQHGTCRFGRDPSHSVLNPSCRAHELDNLYVTDGSFMPTSGGVPATPTIIANSLRVADILRQRFVRGEIAG